MPISHTWSLALLKPAAAVRIQGVGYSEGYRGASLLGSLEALRSLGVRERLGVMGTPKGIAAQQISGGYWGLLGALTAFAYWGRS